MYQLLSRGLPVACVSLFFLISCFQIVILKLWAEDLIDIKIKFTLRITYYK